MGAIGKIKPIQKTYNPQFSSYESALAAKGYVRAPGSTRTFLPYKEANGNYRTGVDPNAVYILRLEKQAPEAAKEERERIARWKEALEDRYPGIDFSPKSKVWNAFSDATVKVSPIKIGSGDEVFDLGDPNKLLNYVWARVHPQIASSLEAYQRGEYPEAQYYIADDAAESKQVYNRKKAVNKAITQFEDMSPTKRKQVARLLGLPVTDSSTEEAVYNMIDSLLKDTDFKDGIHKGRATINVFNDIVALTDESLKVRDLVEQAIRHNIYRIGNAGKIMEGNNAVFADKADLVKFLLDEQNQTDLLVLETKIKEKKISDL